MKFEKSYPESVRRYRSIARDQKYANLQDKIRLLSSEHQGQKQELKECMRELEKLDRCDWLNDERCRAPKTVIALKKQLEQKLESVDYCRSALRKVAGGEDYLRNPFSFNLNKQYLWKLITWARKLGVSIRPKYPKNPISINDLFDGIEELLQAVDAAGQPTEGHRAVRPKQRRKLSDLQQDVWKILEEHTTKYDQLGVPECCLTGPEIADKHLRKMGIKNQTGKTVGDIISEIRKKGWPVENQQGQGYFIPKSPEVSRK